MSCDGTLGSTLEQTDSNVKLAERAIVGQITFEFMWHAAWMEERPQILWRPWGNLFTSRELASFSSETLNKDAEQINYESRTTTGLGHCPFYRISEDFVSRMICHVLPILRKKMSAIFYKHIWTCFDF